MNTTGHLARTSSPGASPGLMAGRIHWLDMLRGLAMVWMMAFHLTFDLNFLGLLQPRQNFYADPLWTGQRTAIVSLFLLCAGLGQAVVGQRGRGWPRFWRRWAQVAGCAALVSLGSALIFPNSWISFGVLHGMAVMLLLARLAQALGPWLWALGVLLLMLPSWLAQPLFDQPWLQWVGLVTRKPVTEDYVPVLPWLGVMLLGLALGQWLLRQQPTLLGASLPDVAAPLWRALAGLGRWPLTVYMLHQPLFLGLLLAWQRLGWG